MLALSGIGVAGAGPSEEEAIKAAVVFNILKFVEWPPTPGAESDSLRLGVLGAKATEPALLALQSQRLGSRTIVVQSLAEPAAAAHCDVVFLGGDLPVSAVARSIGHVLPVGGILTIGDRAGFCADGGMIELVRRKNKLRFVINQAQAESAGLKLSSQLLKVAILHEEQVP